jgi:hypothetical protein
VGQWKAGVGYPEYLTPLPFREEVFGQLQQSNQHMDARKISAYGFESHPSPSVGGSSIGRALWPAGILVFVRVSSKFALAVRDRVRATFAPSGNDFIFPYFSKNLSLNPGTKTCSEWPLLNRHRILALKAEVRSVEFVQSIRQ